MDIDTSLLRERFVIEEENAEEDKSALRMTAVSNRIVLELQGGGLPKEIFVIRTNTMHSCTRFAAQIIDNYDRHGPLAPRKDKIKWDALWHDMQSDYDQLYNTQAWCNLYYKGKTIYSHGEHHPFLDVIEQCDALSHNDYKKSIPLAIDAFKTAGKKIHIQHDSNVALVATTDKNEGRCSMILRGRRDSKSTFSITIEPHHGERLHTTYLLAAASDFLEGVQLCYVIGDINEKTEQNVVKKYSDEFRQGRRAQERLARLNISLDTMERLHRVRYRPERPNFDLLIETSEKETRALLYNLDEDGYVE